MIGKLRGLLFETVFDCCLLYRRLSRVARLGKLLVSRRRNLGSSSSFAKYLCDMSFGTLGAFWAISVSHHHHTSLKFGRFCSNRIVMVPNKNEGAVQNFVPSIPQCIPVAKLTHRYIVGSFLIHLSTLLLTSIRSCCVIVAAIPSVRRGIPLCCDSRKTDF